MSFDVYVDQQGSTRSDVDNLVKGTAIRDGAEPIRDVAERIRLLSGIAAAGAKDYAVSGGDKQRGGYLSLVHGSCYRTCLIEPALERMHKIGLCTSEPPPLRLLPTGSAFLQFLFTLAKPYLSKDDDPLYVSDAVNPVRKDKVFKTPMVAASSWKGVLRWTAMQVHLIEAQAGLNDEAFARTRFHLTLLFGDEKGEEESESKDTAKFIHRLRPNAESHYRDIVKGRYNLDAADPLPHHSGRVICYPSFFDRMDVDVINPHSRKTKAGTQPIYLECVPPGATSTFSLLYVPFDLIGQTEKAVLSETARALCLLSKAIKAMMLTYGFSAKRSSGFGTAEDQVSDGVLLLNWNRPQPLAQPASATPAAQQSLPKYLEAPGRLKAEYRNADGTFRYLSDAELKKLTKPKQQDYDKARKWWEREGKRQAESPAPPPPPPPPPPQPQPCKIEFVSLTDLVQKAQKLADDLRSGGEK